MDITIATFTANCLPITTFSSVFFFNVRREGCEKGVECEKVTWSSHKRLVQGVKDRCPHRVSEVEQLTPDRLMFGLFVGIQLFSIDEVLATDEAAVELRLVFTAIVPLERVLGAQIQVASGTLVVGHWNRHITRYVENYNAKSSFQDMTSLKRNNVG